MGWLLFFGISSNSTVTILPQISLYMEIFPKHELLLLDVEVELYSKNTYTFSLFQHVANHFKPF